MNAKHLIAAVVTLAAAGGAFADGAAPLTREQVQAELFAARQHGEIPLTEADVDVGSYYNSLHKAEVANAAPQTANLHQAELSAADQRTVKADH